MAMPYDDAQNPAHRWITQYQTVYGTVGLYTHTDGNYSFINVTEDSVYAAGITFTETGAVLLEQYKDKWLNGSIKPEVIGDVNQQLIEEAYLLSQSLYHSSWIKIGEYDTPVISSSYAYGWRFNWNGSKAAIVTQESIFHYGGGGAIIYADAQRHRLYEVSIAEDVDNILTATISLEEQADAYILSGELRIWFPASAGNVDLGAQVDPIIGCDEYTDYGDKEYNVPLTCIYRPDGTLRVIRLFKTLHPGPTKEEAEILAAPSVCSSPGNGFSTNVPGTITGHYEVEYLAYEMGFDLDGVILSAKKGSGLYVDKVYSRSNSNESYYRPSPYSEAVVSARIRDSFVYHDYEYPKNYCNPSCTLSVTCGTFTYERTLSETGGPNVGEKSYKLALVFPARSTESVYALIHQQTYHLNKYSSRDGICQSEYRQGNPYDASGPIGSEIYGPIDEAPEWRGVWYPYGSDKPTDFDYCTWVEAGVCGSVNNTLESTVTAYYEYETQAYLVTPYELVQTDYIEHSDETNPLGPYGQYFNPPICSSYGFVNNFFDVQSMVGRSIRSLSADSTKIGSNCEIDVDLPGTTAFWLGAT